MVSKKQLPAALRVYVEPVTGQPSAGHFLFEFTHLAINYAVVRVFFMDAFEGDFSPIEIVKIKTQLNAWFAQKHQKEAQCAHAINGKTARHHDALLVIVHGELL